MHIHPIELKQMSTSYISSSLGCDGNWTTLSTEVTVARMLCAIANLSSSSLEQRVPLTIHITEPSRTPIDRDHRDAFRRCLDRAARRLCPPLDATQYAHPSSCQFSDQSIVLQVIPTPEEVTHSVEGVAYYVLQEKGGEDDTPQSHPLVAWETSQQDKEAIKERSRMAKWMMQRAIIGCGWASSPQRDVFEYANVSRAAASGRGAVHVDPNGMELQMVVVAVYQHSCYLALPRAEGGPFVLVGAAPTPSWSSYTLSEASSSRKRPRSDVAAGSEFDNMAPFLRSVGCTRPHEVTILPAAERRSVLVRAFRVFCTPNTIELDDVYIVGEPQPASDCNTFADLRELVTLSCQRAQKNWAKLEQSMVQSPSIVKHFQSLTDTFSSHFGKARGIDRQQSKVLAAAHPFGAAAAQQSAVAKGTVLSLEESALLEFKGATSQWIEGDGAKSNVERLRHVLAAFANTFGGHLVIGVADDGAVLGEVPDSSGAVSADAIRTTGFCPAMIKDAVRLTKHKVVERSTEKKMPTDWWKTGAKPSTSTAAAATTASPTPVVTVLSVSKGTAPFYSAGKGVLPQMRGAASTLRIPVSVCVQRVSYGLPTLGSGASAKGTLKDLEHQREPENETGSIRSN